MKYQINKAVVVGSGTMGAAIAAHLANAGVQVTLLDIIPGELSESEKAAGLTINDPEVRNRIVNQGYQAAIKSKPASAAKAHSMPSLPSFKNSVRAPPSGRWGLF